MLAAILGVVWAWSGSKISYLGNLPVGVAVDTGRGAVSGPPGVSDTSM